MNKYQSPTPITLTEARNELTEIVNQVCYSNKKYVICKKNKSGEKKLATIAPAGSLQKDTILYTPWLLKTL